MIPLAAIKRFAPVIGIAALLIALAFTWQSRGAWKLQAGIYEGKLREVAAEQIRQNERLEQWAKDIERKSKDIADVADAKYEAGFADARSAAERYAERMRVTNYCRGAVSPAAPAEAGNPPSDIGPGADAIVVSRSDFDILTGNTLRLVAAHDWALPLSGSAQPR